MNANISISNALSSQGLPTSSTLWACAAGLNQVHAFWKVYVKGNTYIQPDNWLGLIAGHTFEALFADNVYVKLPTVPFFVVARFLDLFEQEDALHQSFSDWLQSVKLTYPVPAYVEQTSKQPFDSIFPLYVMTWIKINSRNLLIRMQRIVFCTLDLALQTFQLVMRIMDITELVTLNPDKLSQIATESARQSALNIPRCLNTITKHRQIFLERLQSKKKPINHILRTMGAKKIKADDLIKTADDMFKCTETGLEFISKTSNIFGDAATTLIKKFVYGWSPKIIKKILRDNGLAPKKCQWLKKKIGPHRTIVQYPPEELISYGPRKISLKEKSPAKKPQPTPNGIVMPIYAIPKTPLEKKASTNLPPVDAITFITPNIAT